MEILFTVLRYLLYFVLAFVIIYLILPLGWKLFASKFDATYRPSKLDKIAQPKPRQLQNSIPDVKVDETGGYEISFGAGRRFFRGTFQLHYQGEWYYAHPPTQGDKHLNLRSIENKSGTDDLGPNEQYLMKWEFEGTSHSVHTTIIRYPNQPIVQFNIEFPNGIKDIATNSFDKLSFKFPCFDLEGPNQRTLAYRYALFCPPTRNITKSPTQGPVVFYDNDLNAAVLGPMDHFMIAFTFQDRAIFHGFEGLINEIPSSYKHSALLLFTQGINNAIVGWCDLIHKYHHTKRKDPYADPALAHLGFWTQNGSYYYYRKEKGLNYQETIMNACAIFEKNNIPFKYFQLDSWWYQKDMKTLWKYPPFRWLGRLIGGGAFGGTLLWEPIPEEFPDGMKALHDKINLPFACHARWFSIKTPYIQKYQSSLGKIAALPMEPRFWEDLMQQSAKWGLILYEQDWFKNTFTRIPFLRHDVQAAENWLTWMAEAAHRNNITIQYCMAPSGGFLYALKFPAVTNVRVTGDYHARVTKQFYYPHFSQTNIIAWGIGIWPSLDCYLTTKTPLSKGLYRELYPDQMTLLSNLGGGVICPADKAERVNRELLMQTCTEDGVLLKPDRPITANDLMFKIHQKPYIMDTWTNKEGRFWRYIFVVNLWPRRVKDPEMTLQELGYNESGVLYDYNTSNLQEISAEDKIELPLKGMDYKYFIFAPWLNNEVAFIGTPEKFIACANKLIPKIETDEKTLHFTINYSSNSQLKLLLYSKRAPSVIKLQENAGNITWSYDPPKNRLDLVLSFGSNNTNEITIEF